MIASELINDSIPYVQTDTLLSQAISWMEELMVSQLPIVDQQSNYLGIVEESVLLNMATIGNETIGSVPPNYEKLYVSADTHYYNILVFFGEHDLEIIPVLNEKMQYKGTITQKDLLDVVAQEFSQQPFGTVLVLKVSTIQYSMQEISRLVETNNAKVISSAVTQLPDESDKFTITVKINTADLSRIIATFERFGYQIAARYDEVSALNYDQDRLNHLLRYLEI